MRELSGIGFLERRPLVPVGAGVVMGRVGTLVVARVPLDGRTTGDHKGPHSTTQPLPPLRGRSRFPCLFAKNLYLKGAGVSPLVRSAPTPWDAINRVPTIVRFFAPRFWLNRLFDMYWPQVRSWGT